MQPRNPRETMTDLPFGGPSALHELFQRAISWLTGKPQAGSTPLVTWTPRTRAAAAWATLAIGSTANGLALFLGGPALGLLVPGFVLTVGSLRAMYLELAHAAVHRQFADSLEENVAVSEFYTTVTMTNHDAHFQVDHVPFHHRFTATFLDPDYQTLLAWGFRPGMSKRRLWLQLAWSLISPRLHGGYLAQRLWTNFGPHVPPKRRRAAVAWALLPLLLAGATGAWSFYLLGWLLPLTWGYQVSSLLQMVGAEHLWGQDFGRGKAAIARQTYGRFLGDPFPKGRGLRKRLAQTRWWLRAALYHLPARLAVYIGHDLGPAHDQHHREPRADWANAPYARQAKQDAGTPGWPVPYTDHWGGLFSHIDRVFQGLAALPPLSPEQENELAQAKERLAQAHRDARG